MHQCLTEVHSTGMEYGFLDLPDCYCFTTINYARLKKVLFFLLLQISEHIRYDMNVMI